REDAAPAGCRRRALHPGGPGPAPGGVPSPPQRRVRLRAVLDTTAIQAYAAGSIAVGELIGEFCDEGVRFGIPALCLVEAAVGVDGYASALLNVLAEHRHAVLLPLDGSHWHQVVTAVELLGTIARACAALPATHGEAGYVVTAEPEAYPGIDVIGI